MRKVIAALVSLVVVGLLMVPGSVSAKSISIEVEDRIGDVAPLYTARTYDYVALYGDNSPIVQAGYFDMTLFWFGLKGDTYTFGMEMADDLPAEGDPLPQGVSLLQYILWLDPGPWDWSPYAFPSYFVIRLQYDGLNYHAGLYTYVQAEEGEELMALSFEVKGPSFEVEFTAESIDNIEGFWLLPCVCPWFGSCPSRSYVDLIDYNAGAPGQLWTSIPWPPPEE
jgi:hypothetical protein